MEQIIKKAIEGGYGVYVIGNDGKYAVLSASFWQALGKACGWGMMVYSNFAGWEDEYDGSYNKGKMESWEHHALRFHEINLTQGWDAAVAYLSELIKK